MRLARSICVIGLALLPALAWALGPHEVLVLANENSVTSIAFAKTFARLRGVPPANVVRLRVPVPRTGQAASISPADFTRLIWEPANAEIRQRGLSSQILAWVYSTDFPVAIETQPAISIQGLTFLRNELPDPRQVDAGLYVSPLFAGPSKPGGGMYQPQSFDLLAEWLAGKMPLPSMMLGWTGDRGSTVESVTACLGRGVQSDGTMPSGTVYFVVSTDIRSKCRQWQYPQAAAELKQLGVRAVITDRFPAGRHDIAGLMIGVADVRPAQDTVYLPGAMAEHLTSAGAIFHGDAQTKLTAWIDAGATASAGAVVEPYAMWAKFPHARFFVHYASGCTMIESFYQSIKCPLQILLVGDPLAQPWVSKPKVSITGLDHGPVSGKVSVGAVPDGRGSEHWETRVFLLDGRIAGEGRSLELDAGKLEAGRHVVRAVAYRAGLVRAQAFADREFQVEGSGR